MTELRKQINNIVEDHQECLVLAKSVGSTDVYEGTTATPEDIRKGKTAYSNGKFIEGISTARMTDCDCKLDFFNNALATYNQTVGQAIRKIDLTGTDLTGITSLASKFQRFTGVQEVIIDMQGITDANNCFSDCTNLIADKVILTNTKDLENASFMFNGCKKLTTTVEFDTSGLKSVGRMYQGCTNITVMKPMDFSSANSGVSSFFTGGLQNLKTIEGISNLGKGYTEKTENYSDYMVKLYEASYIDSESVLRVIEGLADLNEVYDVANGGTLYRQTLALGSAHGNKVTAAQKQIATDKGWRVTS